MKISRVFFLGFVLLLSACFGSSEKQKSYTLTGLDNDPSTAAYLDGIIKNRISQYTEAEDASEDSRDVQYREQVLETELFQGLRAKGYYDADITFSDQSDNEGIFLIDAGEKSVIGSIDIRPKKYQPYLKDLSLKSGDTLEADSVLAAQGNLYKRIQKESCAFEFNLEHQVILNQKTGKAALVYSINEGEVAHFGPVQFNGQTSVNEVFLKKLSSIKEGECFRRDKIGALREKILATGLFSSVDFVLPATLPKDGAVPIEVILKERAHRSIGAGASYYTDEGLGVILGWEHRNFLGSGEKFNADLSFSLIEQKLNINLNKPYFLREDQSLSLNSAIARQDTEAYEEYGIQSGFRINRNFTRKLSGSAGADLNITRINEENAETRTFGLLSPTVSAVYDTRDDKLDPHKGWLLDTSLTPYLDVLGESSPFIKTQISAQTYKALGKNTVFAVRANVGSLLGTENLDIPASERFYAGGGGSVRGFAYQDIGPHEEGDPIGGRSIVEGSAEMRFKLTDTIGAVAFVDAGQVSEKPSPSFDNLAVGAGLGLRYYTGFGPLRLDVATPLSSDENVDQNYQIYISIGQAF